MHVLKIMIDHYQPVPCPVSTDLDCIQYSPNGREYCTVLPGEGKLATMIL